MAAGRGSQMLLLITARDVVFPLSKGPNSLFVGKNSSLPRVNVLLLSKNTYNSCLKNVKIDQSLQKYSAGWRLTFPIEPEEGAWPRNLPF